MLKINLSTRAILYQWIACLLFTRALTIRSKFTNILRKVYCGCAVIGKYHSVDMKKNRSNSTNYYPILVYTLVYSWFNVPVSDNKARKEKIVQHLLPTTSLTHSPFAAFFYQPSQIFQLKFVSASDPHYVKELKVQYYFEWKEISEN